MPAATHRQYVKSVVLLAVTGVSLYLLRSNGSVAASNVASTPRFDAP